MNYSYTEKKRIRKKFGKIKQIIDIPSMLQIQSNSYSSFLSGSSTFADREKSGLFKAFNSVFPIKDFNDTAVLEYVSYELEKPKYDVEECHQRGLTYASPLRLTLRLIVWDLDSDTGAKSIRDMKEQDVYMGDIPLMTKNDFKVIKNGNMDNSQTCLAIGPGTGLGFSVLRYVGNVPYVYPTELGNARSYNDHLSNLFEISK